MDASSSGWRFGTSVGPATTLVVPHPHPTTWIELAVMTSRSLTFHRYTPPTPHHDLRWALAYLITLAAILVFLTTLQ